MVTAPLPRAHPPATRPGRGPRARGAPQRLGRAVLAAVLLAGLLVANVWMETVAAERGERLRVLRKEVDRLQQEQAYLRAQVAALRAPERIEQLSRRMGLAPPAEDQRAFVVIPTPPEAAPAAVQERPWWVRLWEDLALAHERR